MVIFLALQLWLQLSGAQSPVSVSQLLATALSASAPGSNVTLVLNATAQLADAIRVPAGVVVTLTSAPGSRQQLQWSAASAQIELPPGACGI